MKHALILAFLGAILGRGSPAQATDSAQFISASIPYYMVTGQSYPVSLTFQNTGDTTWTAAAGYKLGAQAPQDNATWGFNRVNLADGESVAPGQLKTFSFTVQAPAPGVYFFQWRMLQEWVQWFGVPSTRQAGDPFPRAMAVLARPPGPYIGPGLDPSQAGVVDSYKMFIRPFFYWYDSTINGSPGSHIIENGKDTMTDHPADLNDYTFRSVNWWTKSLLDVKAEGFSGMVLVDWNFPLPAPSHAQANAFSIGGLVPLVQALDGLQARGIHPPLIGDFFDTSVLQYNPFQTKLDLTQPEGWAWFYGHVRDFFSMIPPRYWLRIDNKPVLVLYASGFAANYNQQSFDRLRLELKKDFHTDFYIIREVSWRGVQTDNYYTWTGGAAPPVIDGIVATGVGFNSTAIGGGVARVRDMGRDRADWDRINASGALVVMEQEGNEWHEGSDVDDSREYGTDYIRETNANSNRWRGWKSDAQFVRHTIPAAMTPGQTVPVSVTMANTGSTIWSFAGQYRLGSQNPQDNSIWGVGRVTIPDRYTLVKPGDSVTFNFNLTAPTTPGTYNCQWGMLQELVEWFGSRTPNVAVSVQPSPASGAAGGGSPGGAPSKPPSGGAAPSATGGASNTIYLPGGVYARPHVSSIGTSVSASQAAPTRIQSDAVASPRIAPEAVSSSRIGASAIAPVRAAASSVFSYNVAPTSFLSITQDYSLNLKAYNRGTYPRQASPQSLRPIKPVGSIQLRGFGTQPLRRFRTMDSFSQPRLQTFP